MNAISALVVGMAAVIVIGGILNAGLLDRLHKLENQALADPLTGAFNRRHMDACLETAIERRNRGGEPASLLLLDVDRFKSINETLSRIAGDAVLKALVVLVRRRTRKVDVLFRIGGAEFALLLSGARLASALAIAEQIRTLVAAVRFIDGVDISITVGASELGDGQSPRDWLEEAERALHRAKRSGRNRIAGAPARDLRRAADAGRLIQTGTASASDL